MERNPACYVALVVGTIRVYTNSMLNNTETTMATYTYSIFDADPSASSVDACAGHDDREVEAEDNETVVRDVRDALEIVAASLSAADGYEVGQRLYALIWDAGGTIVATPTHELTADDLA